MTTYYLDMKEVTGVAKEVVQKAFPDYTGRKIKIELSDRFVPDQSWSEGSRTTWKLVTRSNIQIFDPGYNFSSGIFNPKEAFDYHEIPKGCFLVQHVIFCGKDMGITIVIRPDEFDTGLLPKQKDNKLTRAEEIVLVATRSLISSCRKANAMHDCKISSQEYDKAVESLIDKGLLRKNKSITPEGKNIAGNKNLLWDFKMED